MWREGVLIYGLDFNMEVGMWSQQFQTNKCDMIKGNESDVADIDFEFRLKYVTNSNVLHCLEIQRFAHISGTRCWLVMGF